MKRSLAAILTMALCLSAFTGCGTTPAPVATPESKASTSAAESKTESKTESKPAEATAKPVEISVVTSYGGEDGNRKNYEEAYKAYEAASGNKVSDLSGTSNEEWKSRIKADFQTGAEPDVLFFFNGVDSNELVEAGKFVSIDEIRAVYPTYASNMKDEMLGASPLDGKNYSVPVNGFWEGLFVNKVVLAECGVAAPGPGYTWEQFLADCETIKGKGFTPIACSLQEVPHYWFEFSALNNGNLANHMVLPASSGDDAGKKWASGLSDIKELFEKNYFPTNTLTAKDAETFQLMYEDKAAFAIDGSWKMGTFQKYVLDNPTEAKIEDFTVTFVPAKGERKATDIIGGLSMGYYITKQAWENPEKQKACVDFVTAMTTDEVVSKFGATAITALKNGTTPPADKDVLVDAALALTKGATGITGPVQDRLSETARGALFADVKNVVTGKTTAEAAIDACLAQ